ncbi:alpha/beta hydrolase [Cohnella lupini]|uniref:Alpha-beta hydrolase superfamily lysophospholipase n=1 Tax=Cohnella lupini TaxID=1294267 RepID=A0A3D9IS80_9BACL|nr:alpha/beta hydrolase [Cohnella lupini]RED64612.1 alpha-beta hydrolase superfamily lysophospholipase [Cohnella lupini]
MSDRDLPPVQTYNARDGRSLCYRLYPANSNKMVILLHGISEDGLYLRPLADFLSKRGLAQVVVPDLRGYGMHPIRRGDVEYIGQYDDDIEDLTNWLRQRFSSADKLIIAGHSGGGANAIRLAAHRKLAKDIGGFLLLAPSIHPEAPINHKKDPWSTIRIDSRKVAFLDALNVAGIRFLNHWIVMRNDKPLDRRHGRETLEVSYRLLMSRFTKAKYARYLQAMTQPTLVLVGEKEEVHIPGQYAPLFAQHTQAKVATILDADHDGILSNDGTFQEVESWLKAL